MASGAAKLIPSDPDKVMVIRNVTPDIKTFSVPFLRFGRIKIGGRGTVVKLATGNLAVFSPVALTDTVRSHLRDFGSGEMKYIVALDQEHHIFVEPWHKAYPSATVIAPETLPAYRDKQSYASLPQSAWTLARKQQAISVSEEFDKEFDSEYVHAHQNQELVFAHKPSRTLIEADLMFNLPATEQMSRTGESATSGLLTRLMCAINHTRGNAIWQRRFLWYAISAGDRQGFNKSIAKINGFEFDRIIPCHGDVIEKGGKGVFQKVFQWHLEAEKKST